MNEQHMCQWCGELTSVEDESCIICHLQLQQLEMESEAYDRSMNAWFESEFAEKEK